LQDASNQYEKNTTHARTTNSTGHAIDVCLNEMRGWTEGKKMRSMILIATAIIRKRWNMEQTVKPHLATRTKILGFDTLLGSWFVHHAKDQQPQKQY